ncbi:MAG: PEGA domain-containing protein [Clostridia bacterium]|nr:PEGA domain-containing protein [Clostridia bacterium]
MFTYKGNYVTYKEFNQPAICTLRGFGDNVYGIEILEYMGYIRFEYPESLDNADVSIDSNKIVKINDLPDEPLAPGDRQVLITKEGVDEILLTVNVAEGDTTVLDIVDNVNIKSCVVTLNVNYEDYYVDIKNQAGSINVRYTDNLEDKTSAKKLLNKQVELPYGVYTFTFSKEGFSTFTRKVELNSASKPLTASLAPKGQSQTPNVVDTTPKYTIKICSTVDDTNLYIDGAFYKTTGTSGVSVSLTEGEHTLRFVKSGYQTLERVLTVNADTSNSKTYPMEKESAYQNNAENSGSVDNDAYKNPGETY